MPRQRSQQIPTPNFVHQSPRLLRIKEAAQYLGASVWFVRSLIWENKIPFLHLGQRFVIDRTDLDTFVMANKQGVTR